MRHQLLVLLSILATFIGVATHEPTLAGEAQTRPAPSSAQELQALRLAQQESLHAAALANGGRFTLKEHGHIHTWGTDLDMLTRTSTNVVVGRPLIGTVRLSPDGKKIFTYYDIFVGTTLKGPSEPEIILKYPGGTWAFSDGTIADVALVPDVPIVLNREYIFFVRPPQTGVGTDPEDAQRDVRVLTLGSQSIFELTGGRVQSLALSETPIYRQLHGRDAPTMLQQTRGLISAQKGRISQGGSRVARFRSVRGRAGCRLPRRRSD